MDLAKQIKAIFPNEVEVIILYTLKIKGNYVSVLHNYHFPQQSTYFIPYQSIKVDNKVTKKNPAQGKLFHRYNNYCKRLIANGVRTLQKKRKTSFQSAEEGRFQEVFYSFNAYIIQLC